MGATLQARHVSRPAVSVTVSPHLLSGWWGAPAVPPAGPTWLQGQPPGTGPRTGTVSTPLGALREQLVVTTLAPVPLDYPVSMVFVPQPPPLSAHQSPRLRAPQLRQQQQQRQQQLRIVTPMPGTCVRTPPMGSPRPVALPTPARPSAAAPGARLARDSALLLTRL